MYQAEIKGKLSKRNEDREDILTSNVFSFFKYADRRVFLYNLLKTWGLEITREDALQAEFQHWPQYPDHTEPDLVIIVGDYYLLIEAKYLSGFGQESKTTKHQLAREAEGGAYEARTLRKQFKLVAITADYYLNDALWNEVPPEVHPVFQWTNWQHIALTLYQTLESDIALKPETRAFAEDLYELFLTKNLRSYAGVRVLGDSPELSGHPDSLFFEAITASYRGSFIGFLESLDSDLPQLSDHPDGLFFEAITASYRGSFIGFLESLDTGRRMTLPPETLFFDGSRPDSHFAMLTGVMKPIKALDGPIFLEVEK